MQKKISKSTLFDLLGELESHLDMRPIANLEVGKYYQFLSSGDLFSRNFTFKVVDDHLEYYDILIDGQYEHALPKDYQLVDTINQGNIFRIDSKK